MYVLYTVNPKMNVGLSSGQTIKEKLAKRITFGGATFVVQSLKKN